MRQAIGRSGDLLKKAEVLPVHSVVQRDKRLETGVAGGK
jgi:hypothetical protein